MALTFETQTLMDTNKRAVIKLIGLFDGSGQETANTKIVGSKLFGALATDSNNNVLVANGGNYRTNYNYSIERISGTVSSGYLQIQWTGSTPATIATLSGDFQWDLQENLAPITNNAVGPTGNISFTTVGATAQSHYFITLSLHKDPTNLIQPVISQWGKQQNLRTLILENMASPRKEYLKLVLEAGKINLRRQGRINVAKLKVSISKNRVVRNKKIAAKPGYEMNRGQVKKMTSVERLHRRMATRRARGKIRAKLGQSRRKWHASMRRRRALGG